MNTQKYSLDACETYITGLEDMLQVMAGQREHRAALRVGKDYVLELRQSLVRSDLSGAFDERPEQKPKQEIITGVLEGAAFLLFLAGMVSMVILLWAVVS